jgi:hypothetical protein
MLGLVLSYECKADPPLNNSPNHIPNKDQTSPLTCGYIQYHFTTYSTPIASLQLSFMMTTHEVIEEEKRWQIKFTELNKLYYTSLLTGFSLASAVAIHPLIFITVRQQSGMNSRMDGSASSSSSKQLLSHLREVGVRGMYRGCSPLLLMGMIMF